MATTSYRKKEASVVSATEAKNNFGAIMARAQTDPVIIENRGHAAAVLLSVDRFERLEEAEYKQERLEALERIRKIGAEAQRRNADLTPDEAEALVKEIVDETFARMLAEGKIWYDE